MQPRPAQGCRASAQGCRASARLDEVCTALRLLVAPPVSAVRVPLHAVRDATELSQHTRACRVLAPLRRARRTGSRDEAWGGGLEAWGYKRAECKGLQPGCTGLQLEVVNRAAGCRLHLQRVPPAMAVPSLPVPRLGPRAGVGMHVDGVAAVVPRAATATRAPVDPEGCSPLPASPPGLQPRRYIARGEGPARDVRDEPAALVEAAQRGERGGDGVLAPRFVEEDPQHDTRRPPGWG